MPNNSNSNYEVSKRYLTARLILYGRILKTIGFFLFTYLLWIDKLIYAIGIWVLIKVISFLATIFFANKKSHLLTAKEEAEETLFLLSKSLASLILYYGIWTHSFEIIFISINIFLFIYLLKWMQASYSNV